MTEIVKKQTPLATTDEAAPERPALRALNDAAFTAIREALRCDSGNFKQIGALQLIARDIDRIVDALR